MNKQITLLDLLEMCRLQKNPNRIKFMGTEYEWDGEEYLSVIPKEGVNEFFLENYAAWNVALDCVERKNIDIEIKPTLSESCKAELFPIVHGNRHYVYAIEKCEMNTGLSFLRLFIDKEMKYYDTTIIFNDNELEDMPSNVIFTREETL